MKVLVSWMNELSGYVSREFYFIMQDLVHAHGWRQIQPESLGSGDGLRTLIDRAGGTPDLVLFWEAYDLAIRLRPALAEAGIRCYFFADDLHEMWGEESRRAQKLEAFASCDGVLCPYAYRFDDFFPELRGKQRVEWIPHSASPDFFIPFHDRPCNKILLSGAGGPQYPFRGRLKDMQEANHPSIDHIDHPGYGCDHDYTADPRVGAGYARRLQHYKAAFTDALIYRYVVAKYFEIPATGTLLFADASVAAPLEELGFIDGVHFMSATPANLDERIDFIVDPRHDEEIDAIRRRGQELVSSRHRTSDRARRIDEVCQ
jgi:hypothetical protein